MKIRALSLSIIIMVVSCFTVYGEEPLAPKIFFKEKSFAAGEVLEGTIVEHTYRVYNRGNGVLRINNVKTSCGCTVAEFDRAVPPGGEGQIKVKFNTMGRLGKSIKTINVLSSDPDKRNETLTLEASIKPLFNITPASIVTLTGKRGEMKSVEVLISTGIDKPLNLEPEGFTLDEGKISYKLETVEAGKLYRVVFKNNPAIQGNLNGELRLRTNYVEKPRIKIGVRSRFN
jgi:hypothetical protein